MRFQAYAAKWLIVVFQDNLSVPPSIPPLKMEPIGFRETLVRNYHYTLCNSTEERSSHKMVMFLFRYAEILNLRRHMSLGTPRH